MGLAGCRLANCRLAGWHGQFDRSPEFPLTAQIGCANQRTHAQHMSSPYTARAAGSHPPQASAGWLRAAPDALPRVRLLAHRPSRMPASSCLH